MTFTLRPKPGDFAMMVVAMFFRHFVKKFQNLYESNMKIIKLIDNAVI